MSKSKINTTFNDFHCTCVLFVYLQFYPHPQTNKQLTTAIVVMTCISEGHHYLCKQDRYLSVLIFSFLSLKPIRVFPNTLHPNQACHSSRDKPSTPHCALLPSSPFSISLTFIFTLIELNKKIMFDIKSFWTCGPAYHNVFSSTAIVLLCQVVVCLSCLALCFL